MDKWYTRFRRGDVWYLGLSTEKGDNKDDSSVQKKSRPYLIVSCEENNNNATTFNVVPICTRNNDHLPMHVFFRYEDGTPSGRNQVILCEQVTTVSVLDFNNPRSHFMYSLTLNLMNQVDDALARQLGLKPRVADMKVLERLIDELVKKKEAHIAELKAQEANMRVETFADKVAARLGVSLASDVTVSNVQYRDEELQMAAPEVVAEMRQIAKERHTPRVREISKAPAVAESPKEKTVPKGELANWKHGDAPVRVKRQSWALEHKKQFVSDYTSLSISEMQEKWSIAKKSIQQMVWIFKSELSNDA